MDFTLSESAQDYLKRVKSFIQEKIVPMETEHFRQLKTLDDPWVTFPEVEKLKQEAREAGLWNLFLPDKEHGQGLSVLEYAHLAEAMGHSFLAPEIFNCNAPDTGNMEVLSLFGSEEQKTQWLKPLLQGEVRSAFCMTEPEVASSDATNMAATIAVGQDELVLNGRKWWSTGIGHPKCEVIIFMGLSNPDAHRHSQHSMVLVPKNSPGVKVERMLSVFGDYDAPYGHGEVTFTNVRLPRSALISEPGAGFAIAQGRLGPGRIHHCMRAIGAAERALSLLIQRAQSREAFGRPLYKLGGNVDIIANARISIEQARLLTLKAAWQIDQVGAMQALSDVSQIKVVAPMVLQTIVDQAIQIHGGAGLSDDFPLTALYAMARVLRLADGPDEVHRALITKLELKKYR